MSTPSFPPLCQTFRALSFDESRLDDKTHGDGGNRGGRTERTFRAGKWDEGALFALPPPPLPPKYEIEVRAHVMHSGECIGLKTASHTASLLGGSNALGEPVPAFVVLAAMSEPSPHLLAVGPVAVVNGVKLGTQGTSNKKGSVDTDAALQAIDDCFIPMFKAHGELASHAPPVPSPPLLPTPCRVPCRWIDSDEAGSNCL